MDGGLKFDYYYGAEAEQFSFYRVPRLLIKDRRFKGLSSDAKLLYGLMLDRMALSMKNGWFDDENRAYIHYTVENIMEDLGCARATCAKVLAELDSKKGIGLIEKKRQGLGKPDIIYVKNFVLSEPPAGGEGAAGEAANADVSAEVQKLKFKKYKNQDSRSSETRLLEIQKPDFKSFKNQTSGSSENESLEVQKANPNYNNTNDTDLSDTNPINQSDSGTEKQESGKPDNGMLDEASAYMEIIQKNIEYEYHMKYGDWSEKGLYEELYEVICEIVCVKHRTIKINGEDYPYELVKSKFLKLDSSHLEYVIKCMKETTTKITNIKAYMVTALYNAPNTKNHYYQQLVQHDMYGSGWEEKGLFQSKAEGDG